MSNLTLGQSEVSVNARSETVVAQTDDQAYALASANYVAKESPLARETPQNDYKCIVIDPPWDQGKTGLRTARPNQTTTLDYPTMKYDEIASLPIPEWAAENAFVWLWATNSRSKSSGRPILQQAFDLLECWGFKYYTLVSWDKSTGPCPFGPYQITTEHCLFGYRGRCQFPKESLGKMKTVFAERTSRHSEKPSILYRSIEQYFPGPRLDVFARRRHKGFDAWGNEVGS